MKAVIISHQDGGSYVLEKTGAFRFVRGQDAQPVGAEVELEPQPAVSYRPFAAMAALFALAGHDGNLGLGVNRWPL